jgi:hypothetical protein
MAVVSPEIDTALLGLGAFTLASWSYKVLTGYASGTSYLALAVQDIKIACTCSAPESTRNYM